LHQAEVLSRGAKFGVVALGIGGRCRCGVVWDAATRSVWFDADCDSRYTPAERYTLGPRPLAVRVAIPLTAEDTKRTEPRTVLFRQRGEGLAYSVRGYTAGTITLAGRSVAALLTDGDADGCVDRAGVDRIWIDLDGDGVFEPITEQFFLGATITDKGLAFLVQPQPDGRAVRIRERPAEVGRLVVTLPRQPGTKVTECAAQLVSEWGELVVAQQIDAALTVPAGKYRIESVRLKLTDTEGKLWHYHLSAHKHVFRAEVSQGNQTTLELFKGLQVEVTADADRVIPGESVLVQPNLLAAGDLYMIRCEVGERAAEYGREVQADIKLTGPPGLVLDQTTSGFN
jgi:hypothetical protein